MGACVVRRCVACRLRQQRFEVRQQVVPAGPVFFVMYSGGDGRMRLHASPTGIVELAVDGLAAR